MQRTNPLDWQAVWDELPGQAAYVAADLFVMPKSAWQVTWKASGLLCWEANVGGYARGCLGSGRYQRV